MVLPLVALLLISLPAWGSGLTLEAAMERAVAVDPRLEVRRQEVAHARALLQEVEGQLGPRMDLDAFVGLSPAVSGSPFEAEPCGGSGQSPCRLRRDRYSLEEGLSPWLFTQFTLVKPLYTFGKLEQYRDAALANIRVRDAAVRLTRGEIRLQVGQAYYGYLAAVTAAAFLEDAEGRIQRAERLIEGWLEEGEGEASPADLYAIQTGKAVVAAYRAQAQGMRQVAEKALRLLVQLPEERPLVLAETRLRPLGPPPEEPLDRLTHEALEQRPEMTQLEQGQRARRALMRAKKLDHRPNLYLGVVGAFSFSPARERLNNPYVYDPFNDYGLTPVVGIQWQWRPEIQQAKVEQARSELDSLIAQGEFARRGIPFQVAEQYHQAHAAHQELSQLEQGARAARRWLVAAYSDFEAGVESADKLATAFQAYLLAYSQYLQAVYRYNVHRLRLDQVIGAYP